MKCEHKSKECNGPVHRYTTVTSRGGVDPYGKGIELCKFHYDQERRTSILIPAVVQREKSSRKRAVIGFALLALCVIEPAIWMFSKELPQLF